MALDVLNETPEQPDQTEAPVGALVKSAAPTKGGIAPVGTTLLGPEQTSELLANMQEMIAKKTGGWHDFMGGIQDALAYTAPVEGGQQAMALQYRQQQKQQEMQDVFNMRQQLAALQSSQQQAQNQRAVMEKILGGGGGAPGAGSPQTGPFGAQPQIPPEIRQAIAMDPVNGPSILQKYLTTTAGERAKAQVNPAWYEPTEVIGTSGQIIKVPRIQAIDLAMQNPDNPTNRAVIRSSSDLGAPPAAGGVNQFNVGNVRPVGQSTGFQQPKSFDEGLKIMDDNLKAYGAKGINTLRGVISRWAPPSENDTVALVKAASQRLGLNPDQKIDLSNPAQRQAIGTALMLQEKGPKQLFAAAPTSTMTDALPPRAMPGEAPSSLQMRQELWKKQQEKNVETAATSGAEVRKKAGDMIAAVEQNAKNADEVIRTADRVIQHATKYPKEFGYGYQQENPILAGAANIPGIGPVVEKVVPAIAGAPGESKRRSVTDADARKLGLDFAAQMFSGTGARLGVGLEQMAANAKGVGSELPAETNALNANLVKVAAEKAKEQASAWREWRKTHGGDNADPYDFMQSAENKRIVEKYDHKLDSFEAEAKRIYPEFFGPKKTTTNKQNRKPLSEILGGQ